MDLSCLDLILFCPVVIHSLSDMILQKLCPLPGSIDLLLCKLMPEGKGQFILRQRQDGVCRAPLHAGEILHIPDMGIMIFQLF